MNNYSATPDGICFASDLQCKNIKNKQMIAHGYLSRGRT